MKLHVHIVTPVSEVLTEDIDELIVPTVSGELTILPEHIALLTQIAPGELILKKGEKSDHYVIIGGFIEVGNNNISILADYAVHGDTLSAAKAQEAKERAERALKEKTNENDMRTASAELQKAILELKIAHKLGKIH